LMMDSWSLYQPNVNFVFALYVKSMGVYTDFMVCTPLPVTDGPVVSVASLIVGVYFAINYCSRVMYNVDRGCPYLAKM